jgi:fatty-acyl-CoA synthase
LSSRSGPPNFSELVQADHVHGSLYTDPVIWQLELERIWRRSWVYVGHASEVPNPNDYVMKTIGPEPIVMTRDRSGTIQLLHNRCSHRGNRLVMTPRGSARSWTCPYHGWTFANDGSLRGYPFPSGYEVSIVLTSVWGRLRGSATTVVSSSRPWPRPGRALEEHLGLAKESIDILCSNSRRARSKSPRGSLQHRVKANWKFLVENETDGYHPGFCARINLRGGAERHRQPVQRGVDRRSVATWAMATPRMICVQSFASVTCRCPGSARHRKNFPDYVSRMNAAYGEQEARRIMIDGTSNT